MKLWLDDKRAAPEGWTHCWTPVEMIALLKKGGVTEISLDHDLGLPDENGDLSRGPTGYDVLIWLEETVATNWSFVPPKVIEIHTDNAGVRKRMLGAVASIRRLSA